MRPLHRAPVVDPAETRPYRWGTLTMWVRPPGECISNGYVQIHALGCGNDARRPADIGDVLWRATDKEGGLLSESWHSGTNLRMARREALVMTMATVSGMHLGQAGAIAKKAVAQ